AAATAPTLFPLVPCGSGASVDPVSVGCLATGFSPDSLTFGWSEGSKELTNFQKYPSVLGSGGLYSMTSQLSIPKADWENKDKMFYCKATNPSGTASAELKPPTPTPLHPTVYVVPPSAEDFKSDKTAKIICLAIGFSPLDVSFKWWNNQGLVTEGVESHGSVKDEKEKYSASSSLRVTEKEWRNPFNSTLTCIARGLADENEKTIAITWYKDNGKKPLASVTPTPELQYTDDGRIQATSRVIISKEEWSSNSTYKCVVAHPASFPSPKEETYRRDNGHVERTPSVFLLPPSSEQNSGIREELPLTCFIKDFYPKDVYVSWLADDVPVAESKFHTTSLIEEEAGKSYSVYSKLSVRTSDWNSGVFYTCVVHHESTPDSVPMITRTIDSSSGKPTLVNLNLKVPDTCRG
ncbi:IGHM protein, partial [Amia calva]|nr:IGHM protein [Amia calva]